VTEIELSAFDFETDRLRLRPLQEGDEALFHGLYTNLDTMRFICPPLSSEQAAARFPKIVARQRKPSLKGRFLLILDKATRQAVGICGTSQYDAGALRLEVGIVLTPEARAQGVAREALTALTKRIFVASPVNEIWARFSAENLTAMQLVVSVGFSPCADALRENGVAKTYHYSLHRSSSSAIETTNCQGAGNVERN
jgi:[ribosomal protein S5]-alanine N-acetyltransferase